LKEKQNFKLKSKLIDHATYLRAMKVEEYNEGRTNADVSDYTWVHGTRQHLRPDTMWADDRYTQITQAEINEAKIRVAAREAQQIAAEKVDHSHLNAHPA
jgi:hypothetical protein